MVPRAGVVDDLGLTTRRSPVIRRSVLKSRQEFDLEGDDETVSAFVLVISCFVFFLTELTLNNCE